MNFDVILIPFWIFVMRIEFSISSERSKNIQFNRGRMYKFEETSCACDLIKWECNADCCCDEDCTEEMKISMNCKMVSTQTKEDCDSDPFLCISRQSTAYLGIYYPDIPKLKTQSDLDELRYRHPPRSFLSESSYLNFEPFTIDRARKLGHPLKTAKGDLLTFPTANLDGKCVESSIRYLIPTVNHCRSRITPYSCFHGKKTRFDYQTFFIPSPRKDVSSILELYIDENNRNEIVPLTARYYWTNDTDRYIEPMTSHLTTKTKMFRVNDYVLLKNLSHQIFYADEECRNVALEVHYNLFWSGSNITRIEADLLLGNLDLSPNTTAKTLTQTFRVDYSYTTNNVSVHQKLSGKYGYEIGLPVLTENQTHIQFLGSESCPIKTVVHFLENSLSGCRVQLSRKDFKNCTNLRKFVSDITKVRFTNIARGGNGSELIDLIFDYKELPQQSNGNFCIVPAHVHLEILYTKRRNILRINAAKVTSRESFWELTHEDGFFEIIWSVHFTQIQFRQSNISKFWRERETGFCTGNICWHELLYAFTHLEKEPIVYRTQWGILLLPTAVMVLWLTHNEIW